MYIQQLMIKHFRNLSEVTLHPCKEINILYGDNAQGKTNLTEAIWLFTGAKSFRGARDRDLIELGCEQAVLSTEFWGENRLQTICLKLKTQKEVFLNDIPLESTAKLSGRFLAVVFSPVHLSLIKEGPVFRRKFLDTALSQIIPKYEVYLREYQRILDQRNALLRDMERFPQLLDTLDIWDQHLAKTGAWLLYCRFQYLKRMEPIACEVYHGISGEKESLSIEWETSFSVTNDQDRDQITRDFYQALCTQRAEDLQKKTTTVGPHRDDLDFKINGLSVKLFGSQGQQRSCVLALKLAECAVIEALTEETPIIILDDVMSELDSQRRNYLLNRIQGKQVFITCCERESIDLMQQGKVFHIIQGTANIQEDK